MAIFKKKTGSDTPIPYSVGPLNIVPLTYAQYQALTPAEKNNGTVYNITDRSFLLPTAGNIDYDNTTSGSTETKVQGELDKLESGVKQLNSDLSELNSNITYKRYTITVTPSSDVPGYSKIGYLAIPQADLTAYGRPISLNACDLGLVLAYEAGTLYVCTSRADNTFSIDVVFAKRITYVG